MTTEIELEISHAASEFASPGSIVISGENELETWLTQSLSFLLSARKNCKDTLSVAVNGDNLDKYVKDDLKGFEIGNLIIGFDGDIELELEDVSGAINTYSGLLPKSIVEAATEESR